MITTEYKNLYKNLYTALKGSFLPEYQQTLAEGGCPLQDLEKALVAGRTF